MPTRTIYFDESGFTGYNLLDPQQPVFSIASVDISEDRAEEILRASFPRYQGAEFHFTNIWRSGHKQGLKQFCNHLHEVADRSFCYATDKRFAVLTKIMDFLVEPAITDAGYDFYDDGFCWKYSNYVHYGLTQFAPPELLDCLLRFYQEFSRAPDQQSLALLQARLRMMAESTEDPIHIFLDQMAMGAEIFERYTDLSTFRNSNSLQTSTMIAVIGHWRQRYQDDFAVIHDASSSFLRDRQTWECKSTKPVDEAHNRPCDNTSNAGGMWARDLQSVQVLIDLKDWQFVNMHVCPWTQMQIEGQAIIPRRCLHHTRLP